MPATQGFDPNAVARLAAGRKRGSRFKLLLLTGAALLGGAVVFEYWLWGWRSGVTDARADVLETKAEPPPFHLPEPAPPSAPPPPVVAAPPPPPRPVPARPALASRGGHGPKLPTKIAFDVRPPDAPAMDWFVDGRRPRLAKGCAIRPGNPIHAVLETTVASEVAGQAIARVSEDVFDSDGVGRLLVPAGTEVVGSYKAAALAHQRKRLDFVWSEMTMPDGTQLDLAGAAGMDAAGSMGVGGTVRQHWGEVIATAALLTVFDAISSGTSRTAAAGEGIAEALGQAAGRQGAQIGRETTRRALDTEPDITVPAGTPILIAPNKTVQVCTPSGP